MNVLRTVPRSRVNSSAVYALALAAPAFVHCTQPVAAPIAQTPANSTPSSAAAAAPARTQEPTQLEVRSEARRGYVLDGEQAPSFRAVAHDGRVIELGGAPRTRPLVVYFYPRDETPGCTVEAQQFRDSAAALEQAGAEVVGVSTDDNAAHRAFAEHHGLRFSLIADTEGRLAAAFGVSTEGGAARRVTFVIDPQGRVTHTFTQVVPQRHADEVLAVLRGNRPAN